MVVEGFLHRDFNPPSPCGEGPPAILFFLPSYNFNPPSPCGEGPQRRPLETFCFYFNPPSPCGEGRICRYSPNGPAGFQSTLPVWGGTPIVACGYMMISIFQSTLPVWGGTPAGFGPWVPGTISIHPPRVGRDLETVTLSRALCLFQSTLPVWGGTPQDSGLGYPELFQSTLPVWGGTPPIIWACQTAQ